MMKSCLLFALIAGVAVADNICCQAITAECRACNKGMSVSDYCFACVYQGLNDAGCYDCSRTVTRQSPSKLSLCQKQTQYAMSIPGRFTPQCNDDGSYASMQCHGSTGYCWCVDPSSGQEIANTRQAPGSIPNCARAGLTACQLQASQASYGYGGFRPRCEADGSYSSMQCHGSTGYCWCVDSHGVEITNTRVPPGTMANCTAGVYQLSACQSAVESSAHIIGAYIPQCEADGTFSSLQCHGSTGYCWCVDKDGNEIDGSRKGPGDMPACSVYSTSPCLLQQSQAGRGIGSFRPQCEDDGTFAKMQCHGSTGYCWCVDTQSGVEINNTRVPPGTMPNCDSNLRVSKCQSEVSSAATVFGAFVPQCAEDGSYSALQCHGSTGYCWCVSTDGTEIPGTRQGPGIVVDCSSSSRIMSKAVVVRDTTLTPCQSQAKQASRGYGSYRPQCEADGSFSRLQCHPSTGYCWCVEQSTGKAIDSSRRGPGNVPDCDSFDGSNQQLSACQLQVSQSSHLLGSYVPQCEADGSYSSLQCHPSTGYCWCVDSNGQEIVNTRKGPGRVVDCTAATLTPCQLQQKQSSHGYGSFAPQCNSDGSYNRVQCHASTGYCWCVQVNGVEVNGTRVPPGSVPDCSGFNNSLVLISKPLTAVSEVTPCEQAAASGAGQIGAYVPQCEEDGSFSALQCWSSTGYCWCVNGTGGEFENSRVRFRVPDCDMFLLSPCLLQRKQASPGFGSFRPRCEADGSYSALQCHGSTGYCWCVSPDGKEIANTRVGPGGAPSCDSVFKPARNVLIARALMP